MLPGSVASGILVPRAEGAVKRFSVEHPSGEFSLEIETGEPDGEKIRILRSSLIRTARALFRGEVLVPQNVWDGVEAKTPVNQPEMKHFQVPAPGDTV